VTDRSEEGADTWGLVGELGLGEGDGGRPAASPHLTRVLVFSGVRNLSRRREGGGGVRWGHLEALRFLRWSKQQNRGKQHWREGQPGGRRREEGDEQKKRRRREEKREREYWGALPWGREWDSKRRGREGQKSRGESSGFPFCERPSLVVLVCLLSAYFFYSAYPLVDIII